jgi:hypothetical protein
MLTISQQEATKKVYMNTMGEKKVCKPHDYGDHT